MVDYKALMDERFEHQEAIRNLEYVIGERVNEFIDLIQHPTNSFYVDFNFDHYNLKLEFYNETDGSFIINKPIEYMWLTREQIKEQESIVVE